MVPPRPVQHRRWLRTTQSPPYNTRPPSVFKLLASVPWSAPSKMLSGPIRAVLLVSLREREELSVSLVRQESAIILKRFV